MSKLSIIEEDPPPKPQLENFSLRRKRRRALHPEDVHNRLAEKAKDRKMPERAWVFPNGFLIKLVKCDGTVLYRQTAQTATYETAVYIRDFELDSGKFSEAWIIQRASKIGK